jgi:hypothetical protein
MSEIVVKAVGYWSVYRRAKRILRETLTAANRWAYTDLSIQPPQEDEFESLDLYHLTEGGAAALIRKRRDDALRAKVG